MSYFLIPRKVSVFLNGYASAKCAVPRSFYPDFLRAFLCYFKGERAGGDRCPCRQAGSDAEGTGARPPTHSKTGHTARDPAR